MVHLSPKFKLTQDLCTVHLPRKFHHRVFNRSEVIMFTNIQTKQGDSVKNSHLALLRYDGGEKKSSYPHEITECVVDVCAFRQKEATAGTQLVKEEQLLILSVAPNTISSIKQQTIQ